MTVDTRHLTYDLVFNLRDLGGYPTADGRMVRWRTLYRGDGLHRLTHDTFAELGIRTVLDLRTPGEIEERGRVDADGVAWYHLPVLHTVWDRGMFDEEIGAARFLADRYLVMLEEGAAALGEAIAILSGHANVPAAFHCAAGKDRTGVLAALVLSLLGVDDDTVAHDYQLSRLGMGRMVEWVKATYPDRADVMSQQPSAFLDAPEEAMRLFLADLRERHGSPLDYAAGVGAGAEIVATLRDNLLEG